MSTLTEREQQNTNNTIIEVGEVLPAQDDDFLTERLVEGGNILGILMIDHTIIADDGHYYSFLAIDYALNGTCFGEIIRRQEVQKDDKVDSWKNMFDRQMEMQNKKAKNSRVR